MSEWTSSPDRNSKDIESNLTVLTSNRGNIYSLEQDFVGENNTWCEESSLGACDPTIGQRRDLREFVAAGDIAALYNREKSEGVKYRGISSNSGK